MAKSYMQLRMNHSGHNEMDVLKLGGRSRTKRGKRDLLKGLRLDTNKKSGKAAFQKYLGSKPEKNQPLEFLI